MKNPLLIIPCTLALIGCAGNSTHYQSYLDRRGLNHQNLQSFQHCQGYGCRITKNATLSPDDLKKIQKIFIPAATTAQAERTQIASAIGLLERIIGEQTGTQNDRAGTFRKVGDNQLDCVDESTNTTIYLLLLKEMNLLKFHDIEAPTVRLPIIHAGRWPHQTAVIHENGNGTKFAVDSWFHDNGANAEIITLKQWKDGWKPENIGDSWL
ncbi:MAG: hypothetical protein IT559_03100 [Alphaproteobacteria bacterium]|nr:hypothetical protein [Alphaproteobacteria bacterium]